MPELGIAAATGIGLCERPGSQRVDGYPPRAKVSQPFPAGFLCLSPAVSVTSADLVALPLHLMGSPGRAASQAEKRLPPLTGTGGGTTVAKEDRGFASMDRAKQREIASKGGKAAHQKGTAHEWTSDEARDAGRKGGLASHKRRREQMASGSGSGDMSESQGGQPGFVRLHQRAVDDRRVDQGRVGRAGEASSSRSCSPTPRSSVATPDNRVPTSERRRTLPLDMIRGP